MSRRSKDRRQARTAKARRRWGPDEEQGRSRTPPPRRSGPRSRGGRA